MRSGVSGRAQRRDGRNRRTATLSAITFENYACLARASIGATEKAGRYANQAEAEQHIPDDVAAKLALESTDSLLEIGCGVGSILIPLSLMVARSAGVDHPDVLAALAKRAPQQSIKPYAGDFFDCEMSGFHG